MRLLLVLCLLLSGLACAQAQPRFVRVQGADLVAPDGSKLVLRGMSIGNWLVPEGYMFGFEKATSPRLIEEALKELVGPDEARAFWRQWTDTFVGEEDFRFLAQLGCNVVRIPFNFRMFSPEDRPDLWVEDGFVPLDRAVAWARAAGLYVVLDMHCAPGGQTGDNIDDSWGSAFLFESEESQRRAVDIWKRIARHYRDEPVVLGYELLNEPIAHFLPVKKLNPLLEPLYTRLTAAIREVDVNHVVILDGAQWAGNFEVFGPPFDPQLLYAFHKYWCSTQPSEIEPYLRFRQRWHVPVWLGESGENDDAWIREFRAMLERNGVGWCFWPYKKLDSESCIASYRRPPYWSEIVRYADTTRGLDFEGRRKARPPLRHAREALRGLLSNLPLQRCRINQGYVKALGLGR
jgi:hypothetical protein